MHKKLVSKFRKKSEIQSLKFKHAKKPANKMHKTVNELQLKCNNMRIEKVQDMPLVHFPFRCMKTNPQIKT